MADVEKTASGGSTLSEMLKNTAPLFGMPTVDAVVKDLARLAESLNPSYEYGHTLTNGAGDFDQMLTTLAEAMVNPNTATIPPFDYAMPEQAAFGWMLGGYKAHGPFGTGQYASTRVFLLWAPWWQVKAPYLVLNTPMQQVADGALVEEIPDHVSRIKMSTFWDMGSALRVIMRHSQGLWSGLT